MCGIDDISDVELGAKVRIRICLRIYLSEALLVSHVKFNNEYQEQRAAQ